MNLIKHNKYPYVVGDRVVLLTLALGNSYLWNVVNTDGCMIEISQIGQKNEWVHFLEIKHATPQEIKAGHRIDLKQCQHGYDIACLICGFGTENGVRVWRNQIESDEVTDIRNHVSPNTKVIDHG